MHHLLLSRNLKASAPNRWWAKFSHRGLYANASNASSAVGTKPRSKMTTSRLQARYKKAMKLTMVTAYDYPSAQICDESLIDMILVGDSVAMVVMGHEDTVGVTMDQMVHHCQAVKRGSKYSFLVGDMPFGSYNTVDQALHNATRLLKEGGMDAVKLEGGTRMVPQVKALTDAGISVIGHIGLTPQSYRSLGGFTVQGKKPLQAQAILQDAHDLEEAGVSAMVLEMLPSALSKEITAAVGVPTIGIGAGPDTSGQVLVYHDMLGLFDKFQPKFSKQYASLRGDMVAALKSYRREVMEKSFPLPQHSFDTPPPRRGGKDTLPDVADTKEQSYTRNIAVVGGGAMGSYFAAQLSSVASNKVMVVSHWTEHVAAINEHGLQVSSTAESGTALPESHSTTTKHNISATSSANIGDQQKHAADVVFILVKARDTSAAASTAKHLVKPGGTVVTIQNGIGYEAIVNDVFSEDRNVSLCFGITSYGARMTRPGVVQAAGAGVTTLFSPSSASAHSISTSNSLQSNLQHCVDDLQACGMQVQVQRDDLLAQQQVWRKLAVNAVVNPLAALFSVSNGELLSHAPYARVLKSLVHEVCHIAGHKVAWSAAEMQTEIENVLHLTSENRNSMLSDIQRDKDPEFENINGVILQLARSTGRPAPINEALSTIFGALTKDKQRVPPPTPPAPLPMQVCKTVTEMRNFRRGAIGAGGETIGFVPTMGALHSGHLSLIKAAKEKCDRVVVSIFVNPTQFAEHEDFGSYPSTMESDLALLSRSGLVDAVFAPSPSEMYPNFSMTENGRNNGQAVFVVPSQVERISAEGKSRPHFFTGVSTVCTKLFNIVQPDVAFFGQKDATQVISIQQIVRELNMPLEIAVVETMREEDGVAMSSRNVYLSPDDRVLAPVIYKALSRAKEDFAEKGERRVRALREDVLRELQEHPKVHVDYISVADGLSSAELEDDQECSASTLLSVAVTIGDTRLIDNVLLQESN